MEWVDDSGKSSGPYLKGKSRPSFVSGLRFGRDEYYRLAGWYYYDTDWSSYSLRDARIWKAHAEGQRNVEIAKANKLSETSIQKIIKRHKDLMVARYVSGKRSGGP